MDLLPKQNLTVDLVSKQELGEVHTPYELINKMFALLPINLF